MSIHGEHTRISGMPGHDYLPGRNSQNSDLSLSPANHIIKL